VGPKDVVLIRCQGGKKKKNILGSLMIRPGRLSPKKGGPMGKGLYRKERSSKEKEKGKALKSPPNWNVSREMIRGRRKVTIIET